MMKLYRSAMNPGQWVAYAQGLGWVMFPATEGGWGQRRRACGLDPMHLREVPVRLAAQSGMPETAPTGTFPHAA
jgi:hypothetical protein